MIELVRSRKLIENDFLLEHSRENNVVTVTDKPPHVVEENAPEEVQIVDKAELGMSEVVPTKRKTKWFCFGNLPLCCI